MKKISLIAVIVLLFQFSLIAQTGYDLTKIVIEAGAVDPTEGITPIEEDEFTEALSLDIVNWNVNWLGAPQMIDNKYGSRSEQINNVAAKLVEINADVYALQEVIVDEANGNALEELLAKMNELAGESIFSGSASEYHSFYWQAEDPDFPPQCLAYIWKNEVITLNNERAVLEDYASYSDFGSGRLPYLLDVDVHLNGKTQRYIFFNIHLKAMKDYSNVRAKSMALLKELLYVNYANNNVVVLGDYNNADKSGAIGEISEWGMYNDNDADGIADFVHAAGNKNNGIEHILLSDNLFDELAYAPEYFRNKAINGTGILLSDHYAYQTRLYVHEETGAEDPGNKNLFASSDYEVTMSTSDYQAIVDYVKNTPELAAQDPSEYDDSEYYFGSSSYYSNFDIRDEKHNSSFNSWEDAIKAAIGSALLPTKFPNAEVNDSVYRVTFNTYSGENASYTFNFECTKSAPSPEFAFTTRTSILSDKLNELKLYPNPANQFINVSNNKEIESIAIYSSTGIKMNSFYFRNGNQQNIDIQHLNTGLYLIKVQTINKQIRIAHFLKK